MKVLSIKAGAFELTRVALLKSPITIGRSPLCDVVIRVQGIKQFHFLLEKSELLTNDIGWDFRDLTREASADSDDSILRFEAKIRMARRSIAIAKDIGGRFGAKPRNRRWRPRDWKKVS